MDVTLKELPFAYWSDFSLQCDQ